MNVDTASEAGSVSTWTLPARLVALSGPFFQHHPRGASEAKESFERPVQRRAKAWASNWQTWSRSSITRFAKSRGKAA